MSSLDLHFPVGPCARKLAHLGRRLTTVGALLVTSAAAQSPPRERFPSELDHYLSRVLAAWQIPGLGMAVVRNDSVLVAQGYGVRELGRPERVDGNTIFDIASLAKSFTATAAAVLVDRGVLHWDDPIRKYLPNVELPTPELTANATLRDFLSHRTGMHAANMMWVLTAVDRAEVLRRARHFPMAAPFRQQMVYSNVGYTIAGEAMAAAAGHPIEQLLRDLVIAPLGLRRTTWSYSQAADMPNVASAHATIEGRQVPIRRERQRQPIAAAAAVQSSAADLAQWMRLHLNRGVLDGKRLVSDSSVRELSRVQAAIPTTPAMRAARLVQDTIIGYGLGLQRLDYRGHPMVWHTGNGDGQVAFMAMLPEDRLGVVVLVNTWSAPFVHMALVNRILDTYLGYPARDWAGEALARVPGMRAAGDSAYHALLAGQQPGPPARPLTAYSGRYDHPLFGPVHVRLEGPGLVLQMGEGQKADLEYHHDDAFLIRWHDPLFRENFTTLLRFEGSGDSVAALSVRINRDQFTARKEGARAREPELVWQPSWPGTEMAVVSGNPFASGRFTFRFRMPDRYWICPHIHPIAADIRTISGRFLIGMGSTLDTARVQVLGSGDRISVRPGMTHFEGAQGETVIEIRGEGPWGIRFVDSRYDPASPSPTVCGRD